ncbi:hypothetical protein BBJ29_005349 [Phytophthora kernoviae]|uniref:Uncharacterized protein n=1 Tax=Phytophthora kernoviae TaxID=325452 RepID=A0A3R7JL00_9STRA|nr:hypothetical protein BBJ29_005349 [Phytophthora kernoviae]
MFKGLTKDLTGSADICTTATRFNKLHAAAYLLPEEDVLFAFESAKEEFAFTNEALIMTLGESATTTRKLVKRLTYRECPIDNVLFETTGRVDRDCEIKFRIGEHDVSIDIARKEEAYVKGFYKTLLLLEREQRSSFHFDPRSLGKMPIKHEATERPADPPTKLSNTSEDEITLVCVVRNILGRVSTVSINPNATIHEFKKKIHQENASELSHTPTTMLDVFSTKQFTGQWARLNENERMEDVEDPQSVSLLLPTQRIRYYFPFDTPACDSGMVLVVAEATSTFVTSVVPNSKLTALPDFKPTDIEAFEGEEYCRMGYERKKRVRKEHGLYTNWQIDGADF